MLSIDEAWAELFGIRLFSEVGPIDDIEAATRALALAVHAEMVEIIKPLVVAAAEWDMKAVYRANDLGVNLRDHIKALGR